MKIRVDRNSVCMGDDVLSHETEFDVPEDMTVKDFFDFLEEERYLPSIQGNDVAWELRNRNGEQGVYFTKTREIIHPDGVLKEMLEGITETPCLFCSIIIARKHTIFAERINEDCR